MKTQIISSHVKASQNISTQDSTYQNITIQHHYYEAKAWYSYGFLFRWLLCSCGRGRIEFEKRRNDKIEIANQLNKRMKKMGKDDKQIFGESMEQLVKAYNEKMNK